MCNENEKETEMIKSGHEEFKKEVTNPESIREKALKLIPDSFDEKDLKGLLDLVKKLGNLSPEERNELLKSVDMMNPNEIVEELKKGKVHLNNENKKE